MTRAPDLVESDNDSFIGDDVDLADDPFVRSHSILQVTLSNDLLTLVPFFRDTHVGSKRGKLTNT